MRSRFFLFYVVLLMGMLLLGVRLFELQIVLGARNRELAEGNRIKKEVSLAPRGIIFDRQGEPLVRNIPIYRWCQGEDCQLISREEALKIESQGENGGELKIQVGRDYLFGSALAHVLGYLDWEFKGTTGVEEAFNEILKGQDGGEIYEVDTNGVKAREIEKIESVPGENLQLSLDRKLSQVALEALDGRRGTVVATEAKTGQVLALVSSPSFDPDLLVKVEGRDDERIQSLLLDPDKPFFNRAIGGVYPPGSTFKIVTATAGLEEGKLDRETKIKDEGVIKVGIYSYANWYFTKHGKTEGEINIVRAIQRSTDTFFYKVGEWLGAKALARWAKAFGLGKLTEIDIPGEVEGLVPTPAWKEETLGEKWFLGNTYHLAIGQADLLATPLQINLLTSVIANQGKLCQPRVKQEDKPVCQDLRLKQETMDLVKEGLEGACSPGGTAGVFFDFTPQVACKTGTAEFGPKDELGHRQSHAWLTAFAPVDDPEIVVTALVEEGGEGSETAAPIVKELMTEFFK